MTNVVHNSPAGAGRGDGTRRRGRTGLTGLLLALCVLLSGCGRDVRPPAAADSAETAEPEVSAAQRTEAEGVSGADSGEAGTSAPEADAASLAANYQVYPVDSGGQGITYNVPPEEEGRGEPGDVENKADTESPDSQAASPTSTQPVEPANPAETGGTDTGTGGASEPANPAETGGTDTGSDGDTQPPSVEDQDVSDNPYLDRQQGRQTAGAMGLGGRLALFLYVFGSSACIGYLFYRVHKLELEKKEKEDDGQQGDGLSRGTRYRGGFSDPPGSSGSHYEQDDGDLHNPPGSSGSHSAHNDPYPGDTHNDSHSNDMTASGYPQTTQNTQPPPPNPQADEIRLKVRFYPSGSKERFLAKHSGGDLVIREYKRGREGGTYAVWPKMEALTDGGGRGRLSRLNLQSGDIPDCFDVKWNVSNGESFWVNVEPATVIATNQPDEFKLKERGRVTVTGI